jgi:predicted DNA binding CopG/RHH family protein
MNGVSQWPAVNVRIHPDVFQAIYTKAQERTLPASVIIREVLNAAFKDSK